MKHQHIAFVGHIVLVIFLFSGGYCSIAAEETTPSASAPRIYMMGASIDFHKALDSLRDFAVLLTERHGAICTVVSPNDAAHPLKLEEQDVLVLYCRYVTLKEDSLRQLRAWRDAGKPIIALRSSTRAFKNWPEFCTEILGVPYQGHDPAEEVYTKIVTTAATHPVLAGVSRFTCRNDKQQIYKFGKPCDGVRVLMTGSNGTTTQPVAWIRESLSGRPGRVFYTSLGLTSDFAQADFQRLLTQAVFWTMNQNMPPAKITVIETSKKP